MTDVHASGDHHHDHGEGGHDHHHDHDHSHETRNPLIWIAQALHLPGFGHTHDHGRGDMRAMNNELGIVTLKRALLVLGITTVLQVFIFLASGSVALLADTVHNLGDALNSIPLWLAFLLARRAATKRFTYGYGRAEDIAGLFIVASIAFSAGYILWESINKLINPQPLTNLGWVAVAALIGFVGNELVAVMQIRVGRQIGSEAMVADGLHARTDGLTSLAVLFAAGGVWIGFPLADPIIGIIIGLAIVQITWGAMRAIWFRLMDAVDPELVDTTEAIIAEHPEFKRIERMQMRWLGHQLNGEFALAVDADLTPAKGRELVEHLKHHLEHALPNLGDVTVELIPV